MPNLSSIAQLIEQESIQCMVVIDMINQNHSEHVHFVTIFYHGLHYSKQMSHKCVLATCTYDGNHCATQ